MLLHITIY